MSTENKYVKRFEVVSGVTTHRDVMDYINCLADATNELFERCASGDHSGGGCDCDDLDFGAITASASYSSAITSPIVNVTKSGDKSAINIHFDFVFPSNGGSGGGDSDSYVTINVTSVPSDATVKINGYSTNELIVKAGSTYTIEVSADGYETSTVTGVADSNKNLTISLTPLTKTINLRGYIENGNESDKYDDFIYHVLESPDRNTWNAYDYVTYQDGNIQIKENCYYSIYAEYKGSNYLADYGWTGLLTPEQISEIPENGYLDISVTQYPNGWTQTIYKPVYENQEQMSDEDYITNIDFTKPWREEINPYVVLRPSDLSYGYEAEFIAQGYKSVFFPEYNPSKTDITWRPVMVADNDSFMIVQPRSSYYYTSLDTDPNNPWENDFKVYLKVNGYATTDGTPVIACPLFIDSDLNYGKTGKEIHDRDRSSDDPTPIRISFDSNIAELGGTTFGQLDPEHPEDQLIHYGPREFNIYFHVNENNYVAGQEIIATITDGTSTRTVTFVIPEVPAYEHGDDNNSNSENNEESDDQ